MKDQPSTDQPKIETIKISDWLRQFPVNMYHVEGQAINTLLPRIYGEGKLIHFCTPEQNCTLQTDQLIIDETYGHFINEFTHDRDDILFGR